MTPTPIIERIKKLMAMADRGTEHEAALAAERMQALLQEHNLTRADVEAKSEEPSALEVTREQRDHDRPALYTYQRELMRSIAENNFCMYFVTEKFVPDERGRFHRWFGENRVRGRWSKRHCLIGRSENVTASLLMYDYLTDTMSRLLPFFGTARRETAARLWLAGCAETLCDRLERQRTGKEKEEPKTDTPGLVRLSELYGSEEDLNNDFRRQLKPGTTARLRREVEFKEAEEERKEKELIASGVDDTDAWYISRGFPVPVSRAPQQIKKETPSETRRRLEAQNRKWERQEHAEWRKEMRENQKRNHPSYKAGRQRGKDIGLGGGLESSKTGLLDA